MNSLGYFVTIDPDECRRLIGDAVVGRVSWLSKSRGLQVLPVNFVLVNDRIVAAVVHVATHGATAPWRYWGTVVVTAVLWVPVFALLDAIRLRKR